MDPGILIRGVGLFLAAFAAHWLAWRLRGAPKAPALILVLHFLAFGALYAACSPSRPRFELAAELLLYSALAAAHVQTLPLMLLRSPTLGLLLELGRAGDSGLSREELGRGFDGESLFSRRLDELLEAGLIEESGPGRLRARPRGKLCVPAFIFMRRVLGLAAGSG